MARSTGEEMDGVECKAFVVLATDKKFQYARQLATKANDEAPLSIPGDTTPVRTLGK